MKYIIIDAALNGTGIRNEYDGGFIIPENIGLSKAIITKLTYWLHSYEQEIYAGYENIDNIKKLDEMGKIIAREIKNEKKDIKVSYLSNATMQKVLI
jgi:hypothetical protein